MRSSGKAEERKEEVKETDEEGMYDRRNEKIGGGEAALR